MGLSSSRHLKVELYKWSSAEFPQEYVFIYTALENESATSILGVGLNPNKLLCRLVDYLGTNPVRIGMEVTAERDNKGNYDFSEVEAVVTEISYDYANEVRERGQINFKINPDLPRSSGCTLLHRDENVGGIHGNLNKRVWLVDYIHPIGLTSFIELDVSIYCDKVTGLCMEFEGPSKYKGLLPSISIGSHSEIDREKQGEPPKGYIAEIESDFKGKAYSLFKRREENNRTKASTSESSTTGLVNNIGAQFQGHGNGSVYKIKTAIFMHHPN